MFRTWKDRLEHGMASPSTFMNAWRRTFQLREVIHEIHYFFVPVTRQDNKQPTASWFHLLFQEGGRIQ
jgi:hypothetical protein